MQELRSQGQPYCTTNENEASLSQWRQCAGAVSRVSGDWCRLENLGAGTMRYRDSNSWPAVSFTHIEIGRALEVRPSNCRPVLRIYAREAFHIRSVNPPAGREGGGNRPLGWGAPRRTPDRTKEARPGPRQQWRALFDQPCRQTRYPRPRPLV